MMESNSDPSPTPLRCEQLLIESFPDNLPRLPQAHLLNEPQKLSALVISPGRAQAAEVLAQSGSFQTVHAWYLDLHDASQVSFEESSIDESSTAAGNQPTVEVLCGADLPEESYDLITMPVLRRGEAEYTRDLLQQAHQRLVPGGQLAVAVDNPKDQWLHEQLQPMFDKVTNLRQTKGCVYWAKKTSELRKQKDFSCQFAFRDEGRLIQAFSRPGVFSHRRLDNGARQLMLTAEIGPQDNVLDMGCGCGSVALAAAFKTSGQVFGVDSNARAIQCLKKGAELNGLTNIHAVWNADGQIELPVPLDVALANPPYFADNGIAQHFVDTAYSLLRPGGALLVVTKQPGWYEAYFQHLLDDVVIFEAARYFIACGRKPSDTNG